MKSVRDTIRVYCFYCVGGIRKEVETCTANDPKYHVCPFHQYRMGDKIHVSAKIIRQFCLQCMGNSSEMVAECETETCLAHPFRKGVNPKRIGVSKRPSERVIENLKKYALRPGENDQNQR